ncbi:MAG: hypothetical protein ACREEM_03580 [Blastocatellia bacterium]
MRLPWTENIWLRWATCGNIQQFPVWTILPSFLTILFGGDACKLLIIQEPTQAEFPNRELL